MLVFTGTCWQDASMSIRAQLFGTSHITCHVLGDRVPLDELIDWSPPNPTHLTMDIMSMREDYGNPPPTHDCQQCPLPPQPTGKVRLPMFFCHNSSRFHRDLIFSIILLPFSKPGPGYHRPHGELCRATTNALSPTPSSHDPPNSQDKMTFVFLL